MLVSDNCNKLYIERKKKNYVKKEKNITLEKNDFFKAMQ